MSGSRSVGASRGRPFRLFLRNDGGSTSLAIVLAVGVAAVLLFSAIQITWVNKKAPEIQAVADAAALSAQNVVAKYMTVARICDAVVLSLTLCALTTLVIATVVSCIPYANACADTLFSAGKNMLQARNRFGEQAAKSLNTLQDSLPVLMQVSAHEIAQRNQGTKDAAYSAIVLPFPLKGEKIEIPSVDLSVDELSDSNARAQSASKEAEKSTEDMKRDLGEAFQADCIDAPLCLYQRSLTLADMAGPENPRFESSQGWSFAVPLARAREYYRRRLEKERPEGASAELAADSFARKEFYAIAVQELAKGHAPMTGDLSEGLYLPVLPKNTDEMKGYPIYSAPKYPLSSSPDGAKTLHYSTDCPGFGVGSPAGTGSLKQIDNGEAHTCPYCKFSIVSIGKVPAASTSIDNGFEHYYRIIALAAARYAESAAKVSQNTKKAREIAESTKPWFTQAFKKISGVRIDPHPPGENGCVVLVANAHPTSSPSSLGPRAEIPAQIAISAANLKEYPADQNVTILDNIFDGLQKSRPAGRDDSAGDLSSGTGWLASKLFSFWGDALQTYSKGEAATVGSAKKTLRSIPGFAGSDLALWGEGFLSDLVEGAGLEPANIGIVRPVLANTNTVLVTDPTFGARIAMLQADYLDSAGEGSNNGLDELTSAINGISGEIEKQGTALLAESFEIASIDIFGVAKIPIKISLPQVAQNKGAELLAKGRREIASRLDRLSAPPGVWKEWR